MWVMELKLAHFYSKVFPQPRSGEEQEVKPGVGEKKLPQLR